MTKKWKLLAAGLCAALTLTGCGTEEKQSSENNNSKYAKLSSVELILADSAGKGPPGNFSTVPLLNIWKKSQMGK